ncbi:hypothetical protein [Marinobacter zhejiangensis]|uniref:Filamentous hemagglutinin n=1 Tax=Marinobacter zhejiangensis TaxID=488535 RepID=A0A1I4KYJ6_9GAMM|nr:hypothetical protein [Marinobacter zhejiangensis]SFL83845.1 hypothetical protein SAMN04487963_0162 [Marinobacter zhejiangensis]
MGKFIRRCSWAVGMMVLLLTAVARGDEAGTLEIVPLSTSQLEASSGRQGIPLQWQINQAEQNAGLSDNVLSGSVVTGDNMISDQAFQNMSGIATVIQNTGNQVVIQDSTQINILINH